MRRLLVSSVLLLLASALPAQTVIRVGAATAIPGLFDPIKEALEKERGIRLVYKEESGAEQIPDLEAGNLDLAVSGITMEGWVESLRAKGKPVRPVYEYKHMDIGVDRLSVLVSPDVVTDASVLLMDLDKAQIKGLFTGRISNWKELGGPDLPVAVIVSHLFAATTKVFQDKALDGEKVLASARVFKGGIYDIAKELVATRGSITFGPMGLTSNSRIWSPAQAPKIDRPFTLVVSDKLDAEHAKAVQSMVEFILGPGQKYITK